MPLTDLNTHRTARLRLLDAYAGALTERQREALRLHLEEDWSVTELAQVLGVSRAAAHDLLRRGLRKIETLEQQLGLSGQLDAVERRRLELEQQLQLGGSSRTGDVR